MSFADRGGYDSLYDDHARQRDDKLREDGAAQERRRMQPVVDDLRARNSALEQERDQANSYMAGLQDNMRLLLRRHRALRLRVERLEEELAKSQGDAGGTGWFRQTGDGGYIAIEREELAGK